MAEAFKKTKRERPSRGRPWLSGEERRRMHWLRDDLERQLARKGGSNLDLEAQIRTIDRELAFDSMPRPRRRET